MEFLCWFLSILPWILIFLLGLAYLNVVYMEKINRDIVNPGPLFVFYNYLKKILWLKSFGKICGELYNKYPNEEFIGLYGMKQKAVISKTAKCPFTFGIESFEDRQVNVAENSGFFIYNMFNSNYKDWQTTRNLLRQWFNETEKRRMFNCIRKSGEDFVDFVLFIFKDNFVVTAKCLMDMYTMDSVMNCTFGRSLETFTENDYVQIKKMFNMDKMKALKNTLKEILPEDIFEYLNIKPIDKDCEEWFKNLIAESLKLKNSETSRYDLVNFFMRMKKSKGQRLKKLHLRSQIMLEHTYSFFNSAYIFCTSLLSPILYELALNKKIQKNVFNEIKAVFDKYEGDLKYESMSEFPILSSVIAEGQRKYPVVEVTTKFCISSYAYGKNTIIEQGATMCTPVLEMHNNPKNFDKPNKFNPERFSLGSKIAGTGNSYVGYNNAARDCFVGEMGETLVMVGLVYLLREYEVSICSSTQPPMYNMMSCARIPNNKIHLRIKRRPY